MTKFIVVDLFCGAGGTTTGFVHAKNQMAKVIACVNHDPVAIKSHWENHKEVIHFEEDILTLDLTKLQEIVKAQRLNNPEAKLILWASLECTNFSKAKGGQARDADSRTLAWGLPRYIEALNPDFVMIENVVEFMSWGEVDEKGKPISRKKGTDWLKWREFINEEFGYWDVWKEMNAADFGAYTSRNRLFGCFAKHGLKIVFPEPTHAKKPTDKSMFGDLKRWKAVKEVLDFSDEGNSIFNRKIPLVEASLERIYAGLTKHVKNDIQHFILKYNSRDAKGKHNPPSVDEPCHTIACQNRLGLVTSSKFLVRNYSGMPQHKTKSVEEPAGTITTIDHHTVISSSYLVKYHGGEKGSMSIDNPASTLTTKDRLGFVNAHWIDKQYSGSENHQSVECPAGTLMTVDKNALMIAKAFLLNPSHGGHSQTIEAPCPVIVARQDKAPLYMIFCELGSFSIPVYENDSPMMVKIKEFMGEHGVTDIKMRMLKVAELLEIQGFPKDYVLCGNQADQKKFIGNSVVPIVVQKWIEAMGDVFIEEKVCQE